MPEIQAATVIALLQRAVNMVKDNPNKAVLSSLTWIETPTSSPTTSRKNYKFTESDASKVNTHSPLLYSCISYIVGAIIIVLCLP